MTSSTDKHSRCPACHTALVTALGTGPYCPNIKCWMIDDFTATVVALKPPFPEELKADHTFDVSTEELVHQLRHELAQSQARAEALQKCWTEAAAGRQQAKDALSQLHCALTACEGWKHWASVTLRLAERTARRTLTTLACGFTAAERKRILEGNTDV